MKKAFGVAIWHLVVAWLAVIAATPVEASRVWGEGGIASAYVGANPDSGEPVYMKLTLLAIGPDSVPFDVHDRFAGCLPKVVASVVSSEEFWKPLDLNVRANTTILSDLATVGVPVDLKNFNIARAARAQQVGKVFAAARSKFLAGVRKCGLPPSIANTARLAIVPYLCRAGGSRPCDVGNYIGKRASISGERFSKVYEWFLTAGLRRENEYLEIGTEGMLSALVPPQELYAHKQQYWPKARTQDEAQASFERGVIELRKGKLKYDYIIPRVAALRKDTAIRLTDVISDPLFSVPLLPEAATGTPPFRLIQDEVARTRLAECTRFKGLYGQKSVEVAKCAGYEIDESGLASCLGGGTCMPKLASEGDAAILMRLAPGDNTDLVTTQLPRLAGKDVVDIKRYQAAGQACTKLSAAEGALCLSKFGMSERDRQTLECAQAVSKSKGGAGGAIQCAIETLPDGSSRRLAECMARNGPRDSIAIALCGINNELPPEVSEKLACLAKPSKDQVAACLLESFGGDVGKVASCWSNYANRYSRVAACLVNGSEASDDAKELVACAVSSSGSTGFAGCALKKNLHIDAKGDVAKLANCAIQSGGDGFGTLACLTEGQLTPEQQIALQCAAQSPDLMTFGVCTAGQLSLREFAKCQDKKFGEDPCFGKNNDIRRALLMVGIDVGDTTVVGQIANFHLDIFKAQVGFAEQTVVMAGKFVEDLGKVVVDLAGGLGSAASGVLRAGEDALRELSNVLGIG